MRIREAHLRKVIRDELRSNQLHEDAVATGGNLSGYTVGERQQIAAKVRDALQSKLTSSGALKAGDQWSITVNIGKRMVTVGKKGGAATGLRNNEIKPHLRAIADDSRIVNRDKLRAGRMLKVSVSDTVAKAEEKPDQSGPRVDRPSRPGTSWEFDKTDCVKKQQEALGVTADGLWGPKTQAAWDAAHPGVAPPGPRDGSNLPACKPEEECPEGEEWPGIPYAPDVCEPIGWTGDDDDEDKDEPTEECREASQKLWRWMKTGQDNPLLKPQFYQDILGSRSLMIQFASFLDWTEFRYEMQETYELMEEVWTCDCDRRRSHVEAAQELISQIKTNADNFGDMFDPIQFGARIIRTGVTRFWNFWGNLWNDWGWTDYFGDLPTFRTLTWSRTGLTGWMPGFDPLTSRTRRQLLELAEDLDRLDCPRDREARDSFREPAYPPPRSARGVGSGAGGATRWNPTNPSR